MLRAIALSSVSYDVLQRHMGPMQLTAVLQIINRGRFETYGYGWA